MLQEAFCVRQKYAGLYALERRGKCRILQSPKHFSASSGLRVVHETSSQPVSKLELIPTSQTTACCPINTRVPARTRQLGEADRFRPRIESESSTPWKAWFLRTFEVETALSNEIVSLGSIIDTHEYRPG